MSQSAPEHPDNQGHVVSHVGLNNDARWEEFRELDLDDQALVHGWVAGNTDDEGDDDGDGGPRARRFDDGMLVDNEILTDFVEQTYLDPTDDRVIDEMLDREVAPGLQLRDIITLDQLRDRLRAQRDTVQEEVPQPIPVAPQRRRRAARTRLTERTNSVAARVMQDLGIAHGRDVTSLGLDSPVAAAPTRNR